MLAGVAVACALAAAVILIWRWPPGGGEGTSLLAVTQGGSLVFVVLLLSLLPGVVEAGRSIGWEPSWILRDRTTWLGFAAVAILSLGELAIAWARPEHAEEGATILMTACGLAITGLLARRLLRMSDASEQLRARASAQIPKLVAILAKERQREERRIAELGLNDESARLLVLTPHPGAQSGMAGVVRSMLALALRYLQEGRWDQALQAHGVAAQTVVAYVEAGRRIALQDPVIEVFCDRTNDLHELAGGPSGRDLSTALFHGVSTVGRTVAASHLEHHIREGGALHRLGFTARAMVQRRLGDQRSTDPGHGLELIGELASAAAQIGDSATATGVAEPLVEIAIPATAARQSHIAKPAWRGSLRVLGVLALVDMEVRDIAALDMWAETLASAIEELPTIPHPLGFSGAEPLLSIERDQRSLMHVMFWIWAGDLEADIKSAVDNRLSNALGVPMVKGPSESLMWAIDTVVEVWHQFACAAANCADRHVDQRPPAIDALARQLARIRAAWLLDTRIVATLHAYTTDWIVGLFATREQDVLPASLVTELEALGAVVSVSPSPGNSSIAESLSWLELALRRAGHADEAVVVASWSPDVSASGQGRLAGLRGGRHLHSGLLQMEVVARAQEWWLG